MPLLLFIHQTRYWIESGNPTALKMISTVPKTSHIFCVFIFFLLPGFFSLAGPFSSQALATIKHTPIGQPPHIKVSTISQVGIWYPPFGLRNWSVNFFFCSISPILSFKYSLFFYAQYSTLPLKMQCFDKKQKRVSKITCGIVVC